jgi:DNA repair protein RadC
MRIATLEDAAALFRPVFADAREERVAALHLSGEHMLLGLTLEKVGAREEVELPVAAILGSALQLGSGALIVAHNHPSGDAEPSEEDKQSTRRLADGARAVGLRLVDHLIFAGDEVRSMAALRLI